MGLNIVLSVLYLIITMILYRIIGLMRAFVPIGTHYFKVTLAAVLRAVFLGLKSSLYLPKLRYNSVFGNARIPEGLRAGASAKASANGGRFYVAGFGGWVARLVRRARPRLFGGRGFSPRFSSGFTPDPQTDASAASASSGLVRVLRNAPSPFGRVRTQPPKPATAAP